MNIVLLKDTAKVLEDCLTSDILVKGLISKEKKMVMFIQPSTQAQLLLQMMCKPVRRAVFLP